MSKFIQIQKKPVRLRTNELSALILVLNKYNQNFEKT